MRATVQRCQQLMSILAQCGGDGLWSQLNQRFQDKAALVEAGVWDCQFGVVDDAVVVEQDVEVDRAWAPALCGGLAALLALNGLELDEQRVRMEVGVDLGNTVEVGALRWSTYRLGFDERCHLDKAHALDGTKGSQRLGDVLQAISFV